MPILFNGRRSMSAPGGFRCLTCEALKARGRPVPAVPVPCHLLSCEARQRATRQTLCGALRVPCARVRLD